MTHDVCCVYVLCAWARTVVEVHWRVLNPLAARAAVRVLGVRCALVWIARCPYECVCHQNQMM